MKVGRNDPCPCGSGKKHKNCCLLRGERAPRSWVDICLEWLERNHDKGYSRALAEFFAGLDEEEGSRLLELPEGVKEVVNANATEWLLAEGEIEVRGARRRIPDLLLGLGGPPLAVEDRQKLQALADHSMSIYEVQEAVPGEGLWVKDAAQPKARRLWVVEHMGSQSLVRWDVVGARLVPREKEWQLSGAIYPIPRDQLKNLKAEVRAAKRAGHRASEPIVDCWLRYVTASPPPLPELVDAGSGDPVLLVTDHYDVADWDALAAALARQPDVEGDRESGWVRLEAVEGQTFERASLSLNLGKANRLEAFAQTLSRAERGAAWLREVAGSALTYRTREVVDPFAALAHRPPSHEKKPSDGPLPEEIHRALYRNWSDEPIPALGGLTPREAIRTRTGRRQVVELLKDYEEHEARGALKTGHEPASFRFLWDELGIAPPK